MLDLSIEYLRRYDTERDSRSPEIVGDHDRNRAKIHQAQADFIAELSLADEPLYFPLDTKSPELGLYYRFSSLWRSIDRLILGESRLVSYLWGRLCEACPTRPPQILGLSVMGPQQLFAALLLAKLAKKRWPGTMTVLGGSHPTLLADGICSDPRYGRYIDYFALGHCEEAFADFLLRASQDSPVVTHGSPIVVAGCGTRPHIGCSGSEPFGYKPLFSGEQLRHYDQRRLTIPLQLTRGCSYGRCAMCTYPAVDPAHSGMPAGPRVARAIAELCDETGSRRFSLKDSLLTPGLLRGFSRVVTDEGTRIEWSATTMIGRGLTPDLLATVAQSGCRTLELGLESIHAQGQALLRKPQPMPLVHRVLEACRANGIRVVINLIYGLPNETMDDAIGQWTWFEEMRDVWGTERLWGSHNLLEINRGSPFEAHPQQFGIRLEGVAPWAFSYRWNAPPWSRDFWSWLQSRI